VVSAFGEGQGFNAKGTKSTEFTETESKGSGLAEYWVEGPEDGLLVSCADKGVPACFSPLAETGSVYWKTE
jgi:hypothetical protein